MTDILPKYESEKEKRFWEAVYYFMEEHNCSKEEAVKQINLLKEINKL